MGLILITLVGVVSGFLIGVSFPVLLLVKDVEVSLQGHFDAALDTIGVAETEIVAISLLKRGGHYMTLQGETASLSDRYGVAIGLPMATAILVKKQLEYRYSHGIGALFLKQGETSQSLSLSDIFALKDGSVTPILKATDPPVRANVLHLSPEQSFPISFYVICHILCTYTISSLELIDIYYDALDAPKTGEKVRVPNQLKADCYPHYMEKGNNYQSCSVLGKICDAVEKYKIGITLRYGTFWNRSCNNSKTAEALVCSQDWLRKSETATDLRGEPEEYLQLEKVENDEVKSVGKSFEHLDIDD